MAKKKALEVLYLIKGEDAGEWDIEYLAFKTPKEIIDYAESNFEDGDAPIPVRRVTVSSSEMLTLERGGWVLEV